MARHLLRYLIFFLVLTVPPAAVVAGQERLLDDFVSLSALEARLFADAADGGLDEHSLFAAALVASGVDDPMAVSSHEGRMAATVARLRRSGTVCGPPRRQLRVIFEFMHREFLHGGYRLDASDLTTVLNEGHFNCVSASVLFCCLCGRFGIEAEGLETPGHAMVRVVLPDGKLDIEATCPQWFRLIDDPRRQAELIRKTLGRAAPDSAKPREFRGVSGVQLVATIYYNRGVDLLGRQRFAEAMAANCKAVRLDSANETARGNLLATLNNWAIDVGSKGQFADAVALLETGLKVEPDFRAFASNYTHVHHCWVESLCRRGRHEEALEHLAQAARQRPQEAWFRRASRDVQQHWTQAMAAQGNSANAIQEQTNVSLEITSVD
jgi:hypothetical protein